MKNNYRVNQSVLFVLLVVSGCCTDSFKQNRVSRQDQAGSSHVAVLSVGPWESYRDAVQPTFKLSLEDALSLSIPNTMALAESTLDAFGAKLKVALPGTSFTDSATTHGETGAVTTTKTDSTKTTTSGDFSKLAFGESPAGSRTAAGLTAVPTATTPLGTEPVLKFLAATALYQEVQLLNRYVKDAAIGDDVAYVVRLQVSLMPRLRDEPYDAYSTISFFPGPFAPNTGKGEFKITESDSEKAARVRIVPLLVTDNIEAMLHSSSLDQIRQFALALSAVIQGVGVGADIQKVHDKLQTVLGRDLNSSFTLARVADNTLRCRFGALNQAQSKYAMIPQTHNVTLLVLVPNNLATNARQVTRTIRLAVKTSFVDLETGRDLPGRSGAEVHEAVRDVFADHGVKLVPTSEEIRNVLYAVADNNYSAFSNLVNQVASQDSKCDGKCKSAAKCAEATCTAHADPVGYLEAFWVDLVAIRNGSQYSSASFSVPQKKEASFALATNEQPVVVDDGKSVATITLAGGEGLDAQQLAAILKFKSKTKSLTFNATGIKVLENGKQVQVSFPSLAAYKLIDEKNPSGDSIEFSFLLADKSKRFADDVACQYLLVPKLPKPGFVMTSRARFVNSEGSKGTIRILFTEKTDTAKIRFTVDGADIDHIESETKTLTIQEDGDGWNVDANGTVKIDLKNLNPLASIAISAVDASNKATHAPIILTVSSQDTTKKSGGQ